MWAKIKDGIVVAYPYGPNELKKDNPNLSLPKKITPNTLTSFDIVPVIPKDPPEHDYITQDCVRVNPTKVGEDWVETWAIHPATQEEVESRKKEAAINLRSKRDRLLSDSDWTQVADAPVDIVAWAAYRQALRGITLHPNWPQIKDEDWPVKPS